LDIITNFIIGAFSLGSFIGIPFIILLIGFLSQVGGQTFPEQEENMTFALFVITILLWFLMLLILVPVLVIRVLDTSKGHGVGKRIRSRKGFGFDLWWLLVLLMIGSLITLGVMMGNDEYDPSWVYFVLFSYLLIFQLTGWLLVSIPSQFIDIGSMSRPRLPSRLALIPLGLMLSSFPALLFVMHRDDSPHDQITMLYLETLYVISMVMWLAGSILLKVNIKRTLRYMEWKKGLPVREHQSEKKADHSGNVKGRRGTLSEE